MSVFQDFATAYDNELRNLVLQGHYAEPITDSSSPASNYGETFRGSVERFGTAFTVASNPRAILSCKQLPFDLTYGVGLFLWCLSGSEDLDFISYYRRAKPRSKKVSFGSRIFSANGNIDLFAESMRRISSDPGTRRAYIPIFGVNDIVDSTGEIPCAVGLHFHRRAGDLHAVVLMRAQNAITAMPMDIFLFALLHQYAAQTSNLGLGTYTHMCSTFHAFENDLPRLHEIIAGDHGCIELYGLGSLQDLESDLQRLLKLEKCIRLNAIRGETHSMTITVDKRLDFQSNAGNVLAACLMTIGMRNLGNKNWAHPRLDENLVCLLAA